MPTRPIGLLPTARSPPSPTSPRARSGPRRAGRSAPAGRRRPRSPRPPTRSSSSALVQVPMGTSESTGCSGVAERRAAEQMSFSGRALVEEAAPLLRGPVRPRRPGLRTPPAPAGRPAAARRARARPGLGHVPPQSSSSSADRKRSFSAAGPVGHPHAPLFPESAARTHDHASLGQPAHDLRLVAVLADRHPGEVRLALGGLQAALVELGLHVQALHRRSARRGAPPRPGAGSPPPRPPGRAR